MSEQRAKVVTINNQKGGPGKTTTVFHTAAAAVQQGKKVLVIDGDENGDLTTVAKQSEEQTWEFDLSDLLSSYRGSGLTAADTVIQGAWEGLDLIPSGPGLSTLKAELSAAGTGRETRLRDALQPILPKYDLILIDSPGDVNQLTANVLAAVDQVFIIAEGGLFNAGATVAVLENVNVIRQMFNPDLVVSGIIYNRYDARTTRHKLSFEDLQKFGLPVFGPIPQLVAIGDSMEAAQTLYSWSREGAKAATYYDEIYAAIEKGRP